MFPSALIRKDKKPLVGAKKVPSTGFVGAKMIPSEDLEGVEEMREPKDIETAKSIPSGKRQGAKVPSKKEDMMSIELMLKAAKKPSKANMEGDSGNMSEKDVNAATSQGEYFKVEKDENAAVKEKYLKAIGKLKKK